MRCSRPPSLDDLARTYCRIALALAERDPDALDFYIGPKVVADAVHTAYPTLEQTSRDAAALSSELQHFPTPSQTDARRIRFLLAQLTAVRARIQMLQGIRFDFDTEGRLLFNTERLPDDQEAVRRAALGRIDRALLGLRGQALAARYDAFERSFLIPPDRVPQVMWAALDLCRHRTLEHIALPAGESVMLEYVRNQPWAAFSRYRGHAQSTLQINMDNALTIGRALELACHEGYPGHHVFNTLWDAALVQRAAWPEAQLQLTFSPQSFVSEAAAAYAPRLAFSPAERASIERQLLPLAGLPPLDTEKEAAIAESVDTLQSALPAIAREYLDGRLEFVRAQQRLEAETLMTHTEGTLLYLNQYRSYMLAYTDGPRRIAAFLGPPAPPDDAARWSRYLSLMDEPSPLPALRGGP
jgi:hypothetical protein